MSVDPMILTLKDLLVKEGIDPKQIRIVSFIHDSYILEIPRTLVPAVEAALAPDEKSEPSSSSTG